MKTLLAIDDSPFSEAATQAVIRHGRPEETELYILHVVAPIESYPSVSHAVRAHDIEAAQHAFVKRGKELVAHAAEQLRNAGFKVHTAVETGDPGATIVAFAAQQHCDLIVVGSHGRKGLDRVLMGSVAEFVAHHASSTVGIVRIPRPKGSRGRRAPSSVTTRALGHHDEDS
jgi:nucleotide-binding universal stress UspA family protein